MVRQLFWMSAGAALGLYGRRKAISTVEQKVPPQVVNFVNKKVSGPVQGFLSDVAKAQADNAAGRRRAAEAAQDLDA